MFMEPFAYLTTTAAFHCQFPQITHTSDCSRYYYYYPEENIPFHSFIHSIRYHLSFHCIRLFMNHTTKRTRNETTVTNIAYWQYGGAQQHRFCRCVQFVFSWQSSHNCFTVHSCLFFAFLLFLLL